jgi:fructokinase
VTHSFLVIGETRICSSDRSAHRGAAPGGEAVHVAVALARLGERVQLRTEIDGSAHAAAITRSLRRLGVRVSRSLLSDEDIHPARLGHSGRSGSGFGTVSEFPRRARPAGDVVHVGSASLLLGPASTELLRLLERRRQSSVISIDANIRRASSPGSLEARRSFERLLALADVVRLREADAAWLYPGLAPDFVIDMLLAYGPQLVAFTGGRHGAVLADTRTQVQVEPSSSQLRNTDVSDDYLVAAVLHGLARLSVDAAMLRGTSGSLSLDLRRLADVADAALSTLAAGLRWSDETIEATVLGT